MEQDKINYTELLEKEYGQIQSAQQLIQQFRADGETDKEIYEFLESFF